MLFQSIGMAVEPGLSVQIHRMCLLLAYRNTGDWRRLCCCIAGLALPLCFMHLGYPPVSGCTEHHFGPASVTHKYAAAAPCLGYSNLHNRLGQLTSITLFGPEHCCVFGWSSFKMKFCLGLSLPRKCVCVQIDIFVVSSF